MKEHELGVIGAGNMGEALLRGVLRANYLPHSAIVAYDPALERRQLLSKDFGITCGEDNSAPGACAHVLLAVKPQAMASVLDEIAPVVRPDATIISIAAGVTTTFIDARLAGTGRIVRVMPNTPMLVGRGVSAVAAGPRAGEKELQWTERLLATSGKTVRVDESMMDAVTAVSGSGPAYFFYLIEAMTAAGVAEGLAHDTAALLAEETCAGAAELILETRETPEVLRARVTSPGGTTQRAVETMEAAGVKEKLIDAIRAAAERSRELGR